MISDSDELPCNETCTVENMILAMENTIVSKEADTILKENAVVSNEVDVLLNIDAVVSNEVVTLFKEVILSNDSALPKDNLDISAEEVTHLKEDAVLSKEGDDLPEDNSEPLENNTIATPSVREVAVLQRVKDVALPTEDNSLLSDTTVLSAEVAGPPNEGITRKKLDGTRIKDRTRTNVQGVADLNDSADWPTLSRDKERTSLPQKSLQGKKKNQRKRQEPLLIEFPRYRPISNQAGRGRDHGGREHDREHGDRERPANKASRDSERGRKNDFSSENTGASALQDPRSPRGGYRGRRSWQQQRENHQQQREQQQQMKQKPEQKAEQKQEQQAGQNDAGRGDFRGRRSWNERREQQQLPNQNGSSRDINSAGRNWQHHQQPDQNGATRGIGSKSLSRGGHHYRGGHGGRGGRRGGSFGNQAAYYTSMAAALSQPVFVNAVTMMSPDFFCEQPPLLSAPEELQRQIEYYFSDDNLVRDVYLRQRMDSDGWTSVVLVSEFSRVKSLTQGQNSETAVIQAVLNSQTVELSTDESKIRRRLEPQKWTLVGMSTLRPEAAEFIPRTCEYSSYALMTSLSASAMQVPLVSSSASTLLAPLSSEAVPVASPTSALPVALAASTASIS